MALQNMEPASPVPGQGHFISLKWRALLLTSIVLVVMIFGGAWLNYDNLSRQLRTQLAQDNAARLRELHALMGQSVERLRQLAGMIPTFPGMQTALRGNDGLAVASVLDAQWPALQFDLGLDRLVVYGSDDASALAQWSVSSGTEVEARLVGLVAMARAQETPQSLLECSPECMHYVAAPMLAEGRNAGVVLLAMREQSLEPGSFASSASFLRYLARTQRASASELAAMLAARPRLSRLVISTLTTRRRMRRRGSLWVARAWRGQSGV